MNLDHAKKKYIVYAGPTMDTAKGKALNFSDLHLLLD
jgi:hypothetical protein